jgi:hypothetical protein
MAKACVALALALLGACGGGSDGTGPTFSPTAVRLSRDTATIGIDGRVILIALDAGGRTIAAEVLGWKAVGRIDADVWRSRCGGAGPCLGAWR